MVVITCPECDGLTFSLVACGCTSGGDRFLVDERGFDREAYRECLICRGAGSVARGCVRCGQRGRRRAQLVLTVANLDNGRVASRNVVPGSIEPVPAPEGDHWVLPLASVLAELAAEVGARQLTAVDGSGVDELSIWLPRWRPELPAETRAAYELAAIVGQDHQPWRLYLGRTAAVAPPDPDRLLGRLCQVADQLSLDLVVEARHLVTGRVSWDLRYELPGADVPPDPRPRGADLPSAVIATTVADALAGLAGRSASAPAYRIRTDVFPPAGPPRVDADQVEHRVYADLNGASAAQAIWRNGRWWHVRLHPGGSTIILVERETGQVARHRVTNLLRHWEPPAPAWQGEALPDIACPDCKPDSPLHRCYCTMGGRSAEPGCAACGGAGLSESLLGCPTCRSSHRLHTAVQVTITDLHGRVEHEVWEPGVGEPAVQVATESAGKPVFQVPERYRLARWAHPFGVRPEDLTELDTGHEVGQDLLDGIVTTGPTTDPTIEYVLGASRGLPAGRLLVLAAVPVAPSLVEMIRLAHGLRIGLAISVENHRLNAGDPTRLHGERWQVDLITPDRPANTFNLPLAPSLEAALATLKSALRSAIGETVPTDPTQPIPVPQTPNPATVVDPTAMISRLGYHYAGQAVTVCLQPGGCRIHLHERDGTRQLARARTLTDALTALGLRPT